MTRQVLKSVRLPPRGLNTSTNPHLIEPGECQELVNLRADIPGRWQTRPGMRVVNFTDASTASGESVIALHVFKRQETDWVLAQLADGSLKAGRGLV